MRLMPVLLLFLISCLSLNLIRCSSPTDESNRNKKEDEQTSDALQVHFQSGFYQDTVTLYHGKEKVYEKVLTTEADEKITDVFSIPKSELKDTLYFRVAQQGGALKGFIPPNAEQYVGFYLTSGTAVNIYSKKTPFIYQ